MNRERAMLLRPQDVLVALGIHVQSGDRWSLADLGQRLGLSAAEVHGALGRLEASALLRRERRVVAAENLVEFLVHGLKYWVPPKVGALSRGVPTAGFGPPLDGLLSSVDEASTGAYVWPHLDGEGTGQSLLPFYPTVPDAALRDPRLHELLALTDALRIGRVRERAAAAEALRERMGIS